VKLRIQGNSLRLRVSRSELAQFVESGRLEDTIYFGRETDAALTYVLVRDEVREAIDVEYSPSRVSVFLPGAEVHVWSAIGQVGVGGDVDLGSRGTLSVLVEKDFACLDRGDAENADTFPNPHAAHVC
jgi:hypothetical protein